MATWRTLESTILLDELPGFHRKFLEWRGVENAAEMPLRRVQQRVESELNKMALEGKTRRQEGDWELLEGFDFSS
ncbi:MAG: hypothetical protein H7095_10005 [Pseudopedobacter sp.]|nr:hypothetical protein [Deinococcales bacterium]